MARKLGLAPANESLIAHEIEEKLSCIKNSKFEVMAVVIKTIIEVSIVFFTNHRVLVLFCKLEFINFDNTGSKSPIQIRL